MYGFISLFHYYSPCVQVTRFLAIFWEKKEVHVYLLLAMNNNLLNVAKQLLIEMWQILTI